MTYDLVLAPTLIEEIIKEYADYAEKNGFRLNPDRKVVRGLIKGLLENEKKYGKRYCPCQRIICPCEQGRAEIKEKGQCLCGLFVKK